MLPPVINMLNNVESNARNTRSDTMLLKELRRINYNYNILMERYNSDYPSLVNTDPTKDKSINRYNKDYTNIVERYNKWLEDTKLIREIKNGKKRI